MLVLTSDIIAAYVSNNKIDPDALPSLIASTYAALTGVGEPVAEPAEDHTKSKAEIRKSIQPDGLISFIDGKTYKSLKRHVGTNGMTMDEYKARFGLPKDYPSVSPNYSAARSALAKSMGLGRKPGEPAPARRGRKPKA